MRKPVCFSVMTLLVFLCVPGPAQDATQSASAQGRDLLMRADAPLLAARTLRMSGTRVTKTILPVARSTESAFLIAWSRDGRVRAEEGSGNLLRISVFDGSMLTEYQAVTNSYSQTAPHGVPDPPLLRILRFGHNPVNLVSAAYDRDETVEFGGQVTPCYVVRASYKGFVDSPSARNVTRTVWITRDRSVVARDSWELETTINGSTARGGTAFNFASVEWDTPLPEDVFVFHPPTGSSASNTLTPPARPASGAGGSGSGSGAGSVRTVKVTHPVVVRRVAPEYSPEAREAGFQGSVLVAVDVDEKGRVAGVRLVRGVGLGLDDKAVEAAKQWEFRPGARDDAPSAMTQTYEVEFRLPNAGRWRVEGAEYRPTVPAGKHIPYEAVSKPSIRAYTRPGESACPAPSGYAAVHLHIKADGTPAEVKVLESSGEAAGQAAVNAIQAWSFQPAMHQKDRFPSDGTILLECGETASPGADAAALALPASNPVIIFKVEPDYTEEARHAKFQGKVVIHLVVDPAGRPTALFVVRGVGLGLDERALEAVAQWRFKPAAKDGKSISVQATVEVNFKLL